MSIISKNFHNIFVTNITPVSNTSPTSITVTNITATNLVVTAATIPNIILSGSLNANFNSNTIANIFTTGGNVGINTTVPSATVDIISTNTFANLYLGNNLQNRKLVLWNGGTNNHQYYGFGVQSNVFRYQVDNLNSDHVFFASVNSTSSNEVFRIKGTGNIIIPGTTNTVSLSSGNIFSTNVSSTNLNSTNITSTNIVATTSTIPNIINTNITTVSLLASTSVSSGNLFSTNVTSTNIVGTTSTIPNLNTTNITTISLLATTNVSSAGLFSTNITSSNIVGTSLSTANALLINATVSSLTATNISTQNITTVNLLATTQISSASLFSTNITSTNILGTNNSLTNLIYSTGTFANNIGTNQTVGTILVTSFGSLIGNTNTIGNIFTTGGNVGVGTVTPTFTLDINGSLRTSRLLINSNTIIATGGTTTLTTTANTNQFVVGTTGQTILLPNSTGLSIGAQYYIANQSNQSITVGNNSTTTLNILFPGTSELFILTSNTSAGGVWTTIGDNFISGSTGNIGLNTSVPATSLDIIGSTRVIGTNFIGNPNNTADNLGIFVDGNNNGLGYRLGMIKKNGLPPFFATNNISSYVFTVANNTDASQITTNSYTTIMTLNTQGHMVINGGFTSGSHLISAGNLVISTGSLVTTLLSSNTLGNIFTTSGNVGINTTAPAYTLDVAGNFRILNNSVQGVLLGSSSGLNPFSTLIASSRGALEIGIASGSGNFSASAISGDIVLRTANNNLILQTSNSGSHIYIATSGNVGINQGNPIYPLHVTGTIYAGPTTFTGATGTINTIGLFSRAVFNSNVNGFPATTGTIGNAIALRVRGGDDAVIDFGVNSGNGGWLQTTNFASGYNFNYPLLLNPNGGNIGINTTSPTQTLDVAGSARVSGSIFNGNVKFNYNSSIQTYTSNSSFAYNNANISSTSYNTGNGYFTAPVSGTYFFSASFFISSSAGFAQASIRKNATSNITGNTFGFIEDTNSAASNMFKYITAVIPLNTGDNVSLWWNSGTIKIDGNTFFQGFLIG